MDEYLETLRIRAERGDAKAAQELEEATAHKAQVNQSVQNAASRLRSQGVDVRYREDRGIEFPMATGFKHRHKNRIFRSGKTSEYVVKAQEAKPSKARKSRIWKAVPYILFVSFIVLGCVAAWVNIAPYIALLFNIGNETPNWLRQVPLVGGLVDAVGLVTLILAGLAVWALMQNCQILWLLIKLDKHALRKAQAENNPDDYAKSKQRLSSYFFIRWAGLLAIAATLFDFLNGVVLYPPAGSFDEFWFSLSTGSSGFDWGNLMMILFMMFAFELAFVGAIQSKRWIQEQKAERKEAIA